MQFPELREACPVNPPEGHWTFANLTNGFFSTKLGSIHCGSNGWVPSAFSMARALAWRVLSPTLKARDRSRGRHVRGNGWVTKKIDPAQHVDDTACPCSWLPRSERARALPAQRCGYCSRQVPVFKIQMPVANVVGHADDLLVDCAASPLEPSLSARDLSLKQP